jgi:hypothetical protein
VLDLDRQICAAECALESDGALIRPDGLHFEGPGADATARWVLARLGLDRLGLDHRDADPPR